MPFYNLFANRLTCYHHKVKINHVNRYIYTKKEASSSQEKKSTFNGNSYKYKYISSIE